MNMELMKTAPGLSTRLNRGNVVIANAQSVNIKPLKARFTAFVDVQKRYIEAHNTVGEAEGLERAELKRVEQLDGVLERAINALSAALLLDGEPRRNSFARFSDHGPGQICVLPFAEKVKAVHNLVANLQRSTGLSKATVGATNRAEQAALTVEEALPGWELRRTYLTVARQSRDAMEAKWDTAYTALRRLTQSVIEDADLYATLFPRRMKRSAKRANDAQQAQPPEAPRGAVEGKPAEAPARTAPPQAA
jgi:hypothetical protein